MLTYVIGSIFESPVRVLVNTVNTVGVMGKGIAKDFKLIYPDMFKKYQKLCETGQLTIGKLWLYKTPNKWILNFPTKSTWREPSKVEYIESGLMAFKRGYVEKGITSIAFPTLGCGNGELNWEKQVRPLMEKHLEKLPIDIFIYLHKQDSIIPEHKNIHEMTEWLHSEPETLAFSEVWQDLEKIIGSGLVLESLTDNLTFHARIDSKDKSGLWLEHDQKQSFMSNEELMEIWNLIRKYGFGMQNMISTPNAHLVFSIFSQLPYCQIVNLSNRYDSLKGPASLGLQVVPRSSLKRKNGILHIMQA